MASRRIDRQTIHGPSRARPAAVLAVLGLAVLISGCGRLGRYSDVDFQASVKALQSIAAEGSLLAGDAGRGRTRTTFVRAHGQELSDQTEHEAEKMSDARLAPGLKGRVTKAVALASKIGSAIDGVRVDPHQRGAAAAAARDLRRYARQVQELGGSG